MEQEYDFEGLERLEAREEGDSEFVEAYSDLGDLKVREKGEELEFVWETGSGFEDVLEAVEMFYRRENSIQFLEKDDISGDLRHGKIRDYVLKGPVRDGDVGNWSDYRLLQIGGSDFYVSWEDTREDEQGYRIRLNTSGSGLRPFAAVYRNTLDREVEDVISDVEEEFYDRPRSFPGFWDPTSRYN